MHILSVTPLEKSTKNLKLHFTKFQKEKKKKGKTYFHCKPSWRFRTARDAYHLHHTGNYSEEDHHTPVVRDLQNKGWEETN